VEHRGREWIEKVYLPSLAGDALFVGVNKATEHYKDLVSCNYETLDIKPSNARYGAKIHHVCDLLDYPLTRVFGHIALYGLDPKYTPEDEINWLEWSRRLLRHANILLDKKGTLLFGGYMGEGWGELLSMTELRHYEEIYYKEENVNGKTYLKWWIKKDG